MKAIATVDADNRRFHLVPQPELPQCAGCAGWNGVTGANGNLCSALGITCLDHPRHGWVQDETYVAPVAVAPAKPVSVEELDELVW